ncbi:hypothetical protein OIU80_10625 [Flavobacterium sp. LS1R47]|uniref:Uncharacterized protein n=1 Tax=Flavobacterium frigoritolerans TaxID=2987686 RepID=A0A9X2ZN09_9FLAO|nr:hypothetical protein [Flavobacterium frigoritolerans]MCV9932737.1 hypothetical protein [Flavobacterium frigoritolerans]
MYKLDCRIQDDKITFFQMKHPNTPQFHHKSESFAKNLTKYSNNQNTN